MRYGLVSLLAGTALAAWAATASAEDIFVGNLYDMTGATSGVGKFSGQGKIDALDYINKHGGINGKQIKVDNLDYSYKAPAAIAAYKRWKQQDVTAVLGWGTADTEALVGFVTKDQVPYYSMSYSAHLTDPAGKGPKTKKATPFNFFTGPSYSDGVRALVQWAAEDWKKQGKSGTPKYVHVGDNHPYPNAPKAAGEALAKELGFDVLPAVQYSMRGGDFKAQCLTIKESGADYAFLANTAGSTIALLRSCETVGVESQFMGNVWSMDENSLKATGPGADGYVWVVAVPGWKDDHVAGMKTIKEVSKMSDPGGNLFRPIHYTAGVCSVFYLKAAMEAADKMPGGITGENIKKAMYAQENWSPTGVEGVCGPGTWTAEDHRGINRVRVFRGTVKGSTDGSVEDLLANGNIGMAQIAEVEVPRKPEWLGW